jgi:hypothetical protein
MRLDGLGLAVNSPTLSTAATTRRSMKYRCEAASIPGFVQQLASCYLPHGYWFYVPGWIPEHKAWPSVDEKLIAKYGIGVSRQSRARRKRVGIANIHYLRYQRYFLLLATHGHHPFYDDESDNVRDARKTPIRFAGYSISVKRGNYKKKATPNSQAVPDNKYRVRVRIAEDSYRDLLAYFLDIAQRRTTAQIADDLYHVPYEPYAPVRQQLLRILKLVNQSRKSAGLDTLDYGVLRYRRRIVTPFEPIVWIGERGHA